MRYYHSVAIAALVIAIVFIQPAYSDDEPGVVILLYPPTDCKTDFDQDFWAKYDSAMAQEWGISSQTICLDQLNEQEKADLQTALHRVGLNVIVMQDNNQIIHGINDRAQGVAQPTVNFGAVEFNYEYSAKVVSHETLHLMLEERGYPKSCYVDAVHEHAYTLARYYDNIMIIQHFEC
ncbi:hypothetical protein Ngar_c10280 [Candidatus Nitrososphaera gargensis Ga9.2]|uniref:Uncharacterized protein n=1 Tax=Nitrososphaera gargensis (strain Ga9.2) TaxID=1237085 RepID=K0IDY7_NITGG|nr:hypothetical protein [Candidatus Nitrososphaera gargensis]AFU57970.1 hypothetical protein Ngar_c10280 [Candidatus Nitrososphaera gargensis Ga9.2]